MANETTPNGTPPGPTHTLGMGLPARAEFKPPQAPNLTADPVAGAETVTLNIDGEDVSVRPGTNVLEAAKLVGKDICHFCYHTGLSIAASCRQCLVQIEKMPKLQPSCQVAVRDGMVVHTNSDEVLTARRSLLEFTLKNHPIDCPICDKAGECTLQRHYMDHDHQPTRVDVAKIRKAKHKDIGREIVLDAERCILCSRCVRFCEEVPGTSELTMTFRGDHQEIDIHPGHRLDNPYSLNTVDVCPVGALTDKDFRFAIRTWQLSKTDTTCQGCGTGCAVELHTRHEQAYRVVPREDAEVNGHWMCDEGRRTYKSLDPSKRIMHATVDGEQVELQDAVTAAAEALTGKKVAVVFSATATNEANLAFAELADVLDAERFVLGRPMGPGDDILRDTDKNANSAGAHAAAGDVSKHEGELALELAGRAYEAVIILDGTGELSEVSVGGLRGIASVCLADHETSLASACKIVLPAASWAEILGSTTNRQGRLRMLQPAFRAEGDRTHRADLVRSLLMALGGRKVPTARERTAALAEEHGHRELLARSQQQPTAHPTLLRWAHTRG